VGIEIESDVSWMKQEWLRVPINNRPRSFSIIDAHCWHHCCAVLLIVTASVAAAQQGTQVASSGETAIALGSDSSGVRVTISTHEVQNGTPNKPVIPKHSACTMSRHPCSIVDVIAVSFKGKALFVPRSAFCDLADVNTASLKPGVHGWALTLVGGDASESYGLTIEFDAEHISRRTFTDGESGQKLQETNYYQAVD
jgi:hypothetical protein